MIVKEGRYMKRIVLLLCIFSCISPALFSTDYTVGTIVSFSGDVAVDHFGNGAFVSPVPGEALYKKSIIKTGEQSTAVIEIMELTKSIPPLSELSVEKVITLESKKKDTGWFDSLLQVINKASDALFQGEENVDFASRGDNTGTGKDALFAYETEEDARPDYWEELAMLLENAGPQSGELSTGELELRKGLCYFGLGNYEDARTHFALSYAALQKAENPFFLDNLILMIGITNYLLNDFQEAVPYFSTFLFRNGIPEYKPFAYWMLADSLVASGRGDEAVILLQKAKESCMDSILEQGFLSFLKEMS
jgi:tetratricopeptide (TPR) repeat protein